MLNLPLMTAATALARKRATDQTQPPPFNPYQAIVDALSNQPQEQDPVEQAIANLQSATQSLELGKSKLANEQANLKSATDTAVARALADAYQKFTPARPAVQTITPPPPYPTWDPNNPNLAYPQQPEIAINPYLLLASGLFGMIDPSQSPKYAAGIMQGTLAKAQQEHQQRIAEWRNRVEQLMQQHQDLIGKYNAELGATERNAAAQNAAEQDVAATLNRARLASIEPEATAAVQENPELQKIRERIASAIPEYAAGAGKAAAAEAAYKSAEIARELGIKKETTVETTGLRTNAMLQATAQKLQSAKNIADQKISAQLQMHAQRMQARYAAIDAVDRRAQQRLAAVGNRFASPMLAAAARTITSQIDTIVRQMGVMDRDLARYAAAAASRDENTYKPAREALKSLTQKREEAAKRVEDLTRKYDALMAQNHDALTIPQGFGPNIFSVATPRQQPAPQQSAQRQPASRPQPKPAQPTRSRKVTPTATPRAMSFINRVLK